MIQLQGSTTLPRRLPIDAAYINYWNKYASNPWKGRHAPREIYLWLLHRLKPPQCCLGQCPIRCVRDCNHLQRICGNSCRVHFHCWCTRKNYHVNNKSKIELSYGHRLIYLVLAFFATPRQWQCFIPFQSKGEIGPQNCLFQSSTAYLFLTLILTLKF